MLAVLDLDPVPETAAAVQTFAMLGDQSLQPEQAGMAEQVGADLALLEITEEDAMDMRRQEAGEVVCGYWRLPVLLSAIIAWRATMLIFSRDHAGRLIAQPAIDHAARRTTNYWRNPEQPELSQCPTADEQRRPGTARRIDRCVRDGNAN